MDNQTELTYTCTECMRHIHYHHMTRAQAEKIHATQCKGKESVNMNEETLFANFDTTPCYDTTLEKIGLLKYLQTEEYKKTQTWNPDENWCRYCGAKSSSSWQKSPWGSHYFCTVHYVQWKTKKDLDMSRYKTLPTEPINISANSEGGYLQRMYRKCYNGDYPTMNMLLNEEKEDSPAPTVHSEETNEEAETSASPSKRVLEESQETESKKKSS